MTHEKFKKDNLTEGGKIEFFNSGKQDIRNIAKELNICDLKLNSILDFGSGVGRLIIPMSDYANKAVAIEISNTMIKEMRENIEMHDKSNIRIYQTVDDLDDDMMFDWINSIIVFQHIPPPIGYEIVEKLLSRLKIKGRLSLHFNIFKDSFEEEKIILQQIDSNTLKILNPRGEDAAGGMQMYDYDLNKIYWLLLKFGIDNINMSSSNHGGYRTVLITGKRSKESYIDYRQDHNFLTRKREWCICMYQMKGFFLPEDWGTWTNATVATLSFEILSNLQNKKLTLRFKARVFLKNVSGFIININNKLTEKYETESEKLMEYSIFIPPSVTQYNSNLFIRFQICNPTTNLVAASSSDARKLGLGITEFIIIDSEVNAKTYDV